MLRRNVLIFHTGALGDLVLSWPLALAAGRLFPQSRIIYVTHGQKGALTERVLRVEWADIESGWHRLFSDGELPSAAGKTLAGAHSVFSFLTDPGDAWSANVRSINPSVQLTHVRARPPAEYARHASEYLLEQLAGSSAVMHKGVEQILRSVATRGIGLRTGRSDGPVVVHPGSGSREKCWPLQRFVELIGRLKSEGRSIRACIGEVERERWSGAEIASLENVAPVSQPANLIELLDELNSASAYIGNDSGPTHLAGILGLPTIAIFTATDPTVWKPLGPNVRVIQRQALQPIDVDAVLQPTRAILDASG